MRRWSAGRGKRNDGAGWRGAAVRGRGGGPKLNGTKARALEGSEWLVGSSGDG